MAIGKGKYDDACETARLSTNADGILLIVAGGSKGSGFSVQGTPEFLRQLPAILNEASNQIKADLDLINSYGGKQ